MNHRERYRDIVPESSFIITYSDLARANSLYKSKQIAKEIYYKIASAPSSEAQKKGTKAHEIKEKELDNKWQNEVKLSHKMCDGYHLCGTVDRHYLTDRLIEDFKCTSSDINKYKYSHQLETYAFLIMQNGGIVKNGRYTVIDDNGHVIRSIDVPLPNHHIAVIYSQFISPRFNSIKREIEELKHQYVGANADTENIFSK